MITRPEAVDCISQNPTYQELQAIKSHGSDDLWIQIKGLADLQKIEETLMAVNIEQNDIPFLISHPQANHFQIYNGNLSGTLHYLSIQ